MKNLEYLKAWINGETVQGYHHLSGTWFDLAPVERKGCAFPFPDALTYRIKPKPVEIKEYLIYSPSTETTYWLASTDDLKHPHDRGCWDVFNEHISRIRVVIPE